MIAALILALALLAPACVHHPATPRYEWGCEPVTLIDGTPIVTCPKIRR